jgi:arginyl-tRNA synthetase
VGERTEDVWFGMVHMGGELMKSRAGAVVLGDALLDSFRDRVAAWEECPIPLAGDDDYDRMGVALVKHHILGFARRSPIDFDEDVMWADATERLGRIVRALAWADSDADAPDDGPTEVDRGLALALAREGAVADRALHQRDPAILVRYVDELADRALAVAAAGEPVVGAPLRAAYARVVRRVLDLLGIELPGQGRASDRDGSGAPMATVGDPGGGQ